MTPPENDHFKLLDQAYPKIAAELRLRWGTADFNPYLESLEQDNGIEHRMGFPEEAMIALMAIGDEHDNQFPELIPKSKWLS